LNSSLVAKEFTQVFEVDYLDIFVPVGKLATIRVLFVICAIEDLEMDQMDVMAAFLASQLDEYMYMYMEQLEGFELYGEDRELLVCLSRKSLYDFKQSARLWNRKLRRLLDLVDFHPAFSEYDYVVHPHCEDNACVFVNGNTVIRIELVQGSTAIGI
jgi:Reverse transcriptase (RNA-dependent DNA polymerase)